MLSNLVQNIGFDKVFECLNKNPLNREKSIERDIDDIINRIGLLRTSLILIQLKFNFLEKSQNINTNNIININSNRNNISSDIPKCKEDINIDMNDINDSVINSLNKDINPHLKTSTPVKSRKNKSQDSWRFKRDKSKTELPSKKSSKSVVSNTSRKKNFRDRHPPTKR